jgi:hypothetical protein
MKQALRVFIFHIACIIVFAILYYNFSENYYKTGEKFSTIDYVLFSTTVQAGVGISEIHPTTFIGKIILIIQQILMIMTHIITLYFFTL